MNKLELIETVQKANNLTRPQARTAVDLLLQEMTDALIEGDRVEIRGFCIFQVKEYKGYTGRNPKTGEKVPIAPKKLPFFKCGKDLKEVVDN